MKPSLITALTFSIAAAAVALPAEAARQTRYANQDPAASVADGKVKPGTWEFTAQFEQSVAAVPLTARPPTGGQQEQVASGVAPTYRMCVEPARPVPSEVGPNCTLERVARSGLKITWSMACTTTDGTVHSDGAAQYRGLTMAASLVNHVPGGDGKATDITQRITGRYLGPCTQTATSGAAAMPPRANAGSTIEPPAAAPPPPATTTPPQLAAPPAPQYQRHAVHHHSYRRRYYAGGPPPILALPFVALHGIFGR